MQRGSVTCSYPQLLGGWSWAARLGVLAWNPVFSPPGISEAYCPGQQSVNVDVPPALGLSLARCSGVEQGGTEECNT